jgi:hypothetical protein
MKDNNKLLAVVQNNNERNKARNKALNELIENGAMEQLNQVICDKKRSKDMKNAACQAIFEIAQGRTAEINDYTRLGNINWTTVQTPHPDQLPLVSSDAVRKAAEIALEMVEDYPNNNHPDDRRRQALQALIRGGHTEQIKRIAENKKIFEDWQKAARAYLESVK